MSGTMTHNQEGNCRNETRHDALARDQALRLLGLFYLQDSSKAEMEKEPRLKQQLDEAVSESLEAFRRLYQQAKESGALKEDSVLARTGKTIDEALGKREAEEVEKARMLLESKGCNRDSGEGP